jgi:hypothetical protein
VNFGFHNKHNATGKRGTPHQLFANGERRADSELHHGDRATSYDDALPGNFFRIDFTTLAHF